jgi:hypothetical protein
VRWRAGNAQAFKTLILTGYVALGKYLDLSEHVLHL